MNSSRTLSRTKILIVDDSIELLHILAQILEKYDYEIITATDPCDISNVVKINRIDLLILNVSGTGTNGRDICRELKSNPLTNYFPVILMSVIYDYLVDLDKCLADDFIEKP